VPASWLDPNAQLEPERGPAWDMPVGLIVFGGAGAGKFVWTDLVACGTGTDVCTPGDWALTFRTGADLWINRFLAVSGSYLKPLEMKTTGSGTGYRFTTTLAPDVATIGGKGGFPIGRVRIFAESGGTYQRSNLQTTQSVNPITMTNDEGEAVVVSPGGTQVFNMQTSGWSWYVDAGVEVWLSPKWGVYGEAGRVGLHGTPRAGGEGGLEETVIYFVGGVRVRLR